MTSLYPGYRKLHHVYELFLSRDLLIAVIVCNYANYMLIWKRSLPKCNCVDDIASTRLLYAVHYIAGAILISQWIQATHKVDGAMVTRQLDDIATTVGTQLLLANDITASHDVLSAVKKLSLPSSVILEAINNVLYKQMKFEGNRDDYYNPNNSYIDKVCSITYDTKFSWGTFELFLLIFPSMDD